MNEYTAKKRKIIKQKRRIRNITFVTILFLFAISIIAVVNAFKFSNSYNKNGLVNPTAHKNTTSSINSFNSQQDYPNWNLILVNAWNSIPDNYSVSLKQLKNNQLVDERIYDDLQAMFDDAVSDGVYPLIGSSYRTNDKQKELYNDKLTAYKAEGYSKTEAKKLTEDWVALPGTSEHQLGLALDINAQKDKCTNNDVYIWLNENSYKYGFILRYPFDKSKITGVSYEPWHYRYVGKEVAKDIYEQGVCLEEYLENLS